MRVSRHQANDDMDMLDWQDDRGYAVKMCKLSEFCAFSISYFAVQKKSHDTINKS